MIISTAGFVLLVAAVIGLPKFINGILCGLGRAIGFNEERAAEKLAFASEIVRAVSKREDKTASPVLAEIVRVVSNQPAKR